MPARPEPPLVTQHAIRPPRLAGPQIERYDGFQEGTWLLARLGETAVRRVAGSDAGGFGIRLAERAVNEASWQIRGRRRKHRRPRIAPGQATVVRKRIAL